MKKFRKMRLLFSSSILAILTCTQILYARGGAIIFGPDGKIQRPPTREEYRKFPGENLPIKVGDKWLVPIVVGRNYDSHPQYVKASLFDFWVGKVKRIPSDRPKGEILSQTPEGKTLVSKPSSVDITISSGSSK